MMPKYYFHLLDDVDTPDEEGKELPDLPSALLYASDQAKFTAAETVKEEGTYNPQHRIDIEDEQGAVLGTVRFADVVKIEN
jgi:hypothetical protein